jgi:FAD/FMN-containing dehydrogenase
MSITIDGHVLEGFTGELLTPRSTTYDDVRRVWNGSIDRRPAFIARCHGTADVIAAVRFGRRHDLPIAVRGGGHSIPGYSVCEGGLMIDLQPMKDVVIDPRTRTGMVAPGVLWQEFDAAAQEHGLATPGGEISDTRVAGLTLGGGIGWLSRLHGLAADNLVGAELVTAAGDVLDVSDDSDPDLMWGLRGGGGNFGIVTRFTFRLHPVGPFYGGMVMYGGDVAADVLRAALSVGDSAPRETGLVAALLSAPPAPFIPPELIGRPIAAIAAAHFGDVEQGRRLIEPLRHLGAPIVDTFGETSYVPLQRMFDEGTPWGLQTYVKSDFLRGLDEDAIAALVAHGTTPSSPMNQVLLRRMGGRISDVASEATAFATRDAEHMLLLAGTWVDPTADRTPHVDWVRSAWTALRPWASGTYVNHLGDEGPERLREAYPPATWKRLTELKGRLDPDNVFALNQNIPPAQSR